MQLILFILLFQIFKCEREEEYTKVHIVAHSHCDPGFCKTYEEYFNDEVQFIISRTVDYLTEHPEAKYNWVETSFLSMWWDIASDSQKQKFLRLVHDTKQIEIVMGGWVMHDHASPTYSSCIDQMTHGHQFLIDNVNIKPRQGWSIDPFGLSSTMPSLYRMMDFDYMAFRRIPEFLKKEWILEKKLNFYWRGSNSLSDEESELFSRAFFGSYMGSIFNWEGKSNPVTEENIEVMARKLAGDIELKTIPLINEGHLLYLFGHDFWFQNPSQDMNDNNLIIKK